MIQDNTLLQRNVSQWKSHLLQEKTTKETFRFPYPKEQTLVYLHALYEVQVESRHRTLCASEELDRQLEHVAEWLTIESHKCWLMLCGVCGNGKTTMLLAIQDLFNQFRIFRPNDSLRMGIRITTAKDVSRMAVEDGNAYRSVMDCPALAIDDVGTEPAEVLNYGNTITPMADLLSYRYDHMLTTLISTNLRPEDFRERYGTRIADRLKEMTEKIIFKTDSYR